MGLRVCDNVVIVDHSVKAHMVTTLSGNPTEDRINGLIVFSVFKRLPNSAKQSRDRDLKRLGDNCPLIYALKGRDGLSVRFSSIKKLNQNIPDIIGKIINEIDVNFDVIVSMPSSSPLAEMLAKRVSRTTKKPYVRNVFEKATKRQAMAEIAQILARDPKTLPREDVSSLGNVLKKFSKVPNEVYTAKEVKTHIRRHFSPLVIGCVPPEFNNETKVLLIDDLLSTGGTLIAAQKLLAQNGITSQPVCVTWFSRV